MPLYTKMLININCKSVLFLEQQAFIGLFVHTASEPNGITLNNMPLFFYV